MPTQGKEIKNVAMGVRNLAAKEWGVIKSPMTTLGLSARAGPRSDDAEVGNESGRKETTHFTARPKARRSDEEFVKGKPKPGGKRYVKVFP